MDLRVIGSWIYIYTNPKLSIEDPSTNRYETVLALPATTVCGIRFDEKAFEISLYAQGHLTPIFIIFRNDVEYLVAKSGLVLLLQEYGLAPKAVFHTINSETLEHGTP
jgi:hypothetical protein